MRSLCRAAAAGGSQDPKTKPRVVRGLGLPQGLLSRFEVFLLAEEEGFEPSVVLPLRLISSQVHSTTLPPLRIRFRLSKQHSIRPKTSPRRSQEPAQPAPNERWLESSPGKKISLKCLFESTIFPRARLVCACSVILQLILYPLNPQYRPPCI